MKFDHYTTDDFLMDDSFVAYRQGTDPDAMAFWLQWQRGHPANLSAFREAERIYELLSGQKPALEDSFQELKMLITDRQEAATELGGYPPNRPGFRAGWWAVAAALLLVSGLIGYQFWRNQIVSYQTEYGQQKTVELPDGSQVVLNSHSRLYHRRSWDADGSREVTLEGEGFFVVRHLDANTPFRVTGGGFAVQVVGTEFTLIHRTGIDRVVLNRGKVVVSRPTNEPALTLEPGQLAELDATTGSLVRRKVPAERYNAWLRNQFILDGATLPEAVRQAEEQFGIEVRFNPVDVSNRQFTGILPLNDPEKVVTVLASYHHLKVSRQGRVYQLSR